MLRRRDDVSSLVGKKSDVLFSVGRGLRQRCGASPVLVPAIDIEDFSRVGAAHVVAQAGGLARHRIARRHTGEREDVRWIEKRRVRLRIARRLREAMIEAPSAGTGRVHEESVERRPTALIGIEALVQVVANESPGL